MARLNDNEPPREDTLETDYKPSLQAWNFHRDHARFRYLIWGIKSGKSRAGAEEFVRGALGLPGTLCWVVAPTYLHLQVAEREIEQILSQYEGLVIGRHRARHEYRLRNGVTIQLKSAEWPDNLRGPNIDGIVWIDEGAFVKAEAWWIVRERIAATLAELIVTTTPKGRNWVWSEVQQCGMPASAPYGEFTSGERWVSHFPTWDFPWVPKSEIEEVKRVMPRDVYDQEFGAMFISEASQVFRHVEESLTWEPPPSKKPDATVIGLDLAKHQDFSACVVMDSGGRVLLVDRWARLDWTVQIARIQQMASDWHATVTMDRSNVGSKIEEDLRNLGVPVDPVDMNSPQVKENLIQTLQVGFEQRRLKIPHPNAEFSPSAVRFLLDELTSYEISLTRGGRRSYGAPKGLHDDLVIALALAYYGRMRGMAGGLAPVAVILPRHEWDDDQGGNGRERRLPNLHAPRPAVFRRMYSRRSRLGFEGTGGPLWS